MMDVLGIYNENNETCQNCSKKEEKMRSNGDGSKSN
jgi:hypothetical protein